MTVESLQPAALPVVTDRTTEVREPVAALPAAVALVIAQRRRVTVRAERLRVLLKPRIVGGDVTGAAAVHLRIAELSDDILLDAGMALVQGRPLPLVLRKRTRLIEVSSLVPLPAVKELIVENDAVYDQGHETSYRQ